MLTQQEIDEFCEDAVIRALDDDLAFKTARDENGRLTVIPLVLEFPGI